MLTRQPESVRILLAEDNKLLRDSYARIFRQQGFDVTAVVNGQQAIDTVCSRKRFNIILMDGQIPIRDAIRRRGKVKIARSLRSRASRSSRSPLRPSWVNASDVWQQVWTTISANL